MLYNIYEEFLPDVEKKLKRIGKKCNKHGNAFTYKVVDTIIKEVEDEDGRKNHYRFCVIEVEGTAKIDDWECIAVLEIHESGNIIRKINTEMDIPERFRYTKNVCEHCNSKRFRNNLFVIHNTKTDEWKQVGKTCLKLYTDGLNAEYVAAYMDGITELEEHNMYVGVHGKPMYDIHEVLGYATEIIDKVGYFNSESNLPTKSLVASMLFGRTDLSSRIRELNRMINEYHIVFGNGDFFKESTDERVEEIIKYYLEQEDNTEFMHNIHVMLTEGYVTSKSIGYLCYLPEGYSRYIQRKIEKGKQLAEENSFHYGEVGKRYKNLEVRYIKVLASYETMYGINYFCKIVLNDGSVLYWSGSGVSSEMYNSETNRFVPCIPDRISFTVKEHGEYKGVPQTKVTRCKITYKAVQ